MKAKFRMLMIAASCSVAAFSLAAYSGTVNYAAAAAMVQSPSAAANKQAAAKVSPALEHMVGHYVVDGKNPDGTAYSGVAWIQPGVNDTVRIDWSIKIPPFEGFSSYVGTGRLQADGTLKVVYAGTLDGTQTFTLRPDGTLDSSYSDSTGTGTERFIPVNQLLRR